MAVAIINRLVFAGWAGQDVFMDENEYTDAKQRKGMHLCNVWEACGNISYSCAPCKQM